MNKFFTLTTIVLASLTAITLGAEDQQSAVVELFGERDLKTKCLPKNGLNIEKCNELIAKGCPMSWVGKGSCKKCADGGCQLNTFCGFLTEDKCRNFKSRGCVWTGFICFGPTLKPTKKPSAKPTTQPTSQPTTSPSTSPTKNPTTPTKSPTKNPTSNPVAPGRLLGEVTPDFETAYKQINKLVNMDARVNNFAEIPNIVNFVWIKEQGKPMEMQLSEFIAIYSAYYHMKPQKIFIHSYPTADVTQMNEIAQIIATVPNVQFVALELMDTTNNGMPIEKVAHKSDFARAAILQNGGVYLDMDAYVLRDISPLRTAGFETVFGEQIDGQIGNGFMMAAPQSKLIQIFGELMHELYDGSWQAHSIKLISKLVRERFSSPKEVLVLPHDALLPLSWYNSDLKMLYAENEREYDWRLSYAIHGYQSAVLDPTVESSLQDTVRNMNVEYILRKSSNFARAVYPAVQHAVDMGYLKVGMTNNKNIQSVKAISSSSSKQEQIEKVMKELNIDVFVVNLPNKFNNWKTVQGEIERSNILQRGNVQRFTAVNGRETDVMSLYNHQKVTKDAYLSILETRPVAGEAMTAGALGCALSHIALWKKCAELGKPILVLEDDVTLVSENFDAKLAEAMVDLPKDFGILYFADLVNSERSKTATQDFQGTSLNVLSGEFWGTYAYLISPKAAEILYKNAFPLKEQVDSIMMRIANQQHISVYRTKSDLIKTDNTKGRSSDVQIYEKDVEKLKAEKSSSLNNIHVVQYTSQNSAPVANAKVWNKKTAIAQFGDKVANFDNTDAFFNLKLLRLELSILNREGGVLFVDSWVPKGEEFSHLISSVIPKITLGTDGFISYAKDATIGFEYPIVAFAKESTVLSQIINEIDQAIVSDNSNPALVMGRLQSTLLTMLKRQGSMDKRANGIIFPVELLIEQQQSVQPIVSISTA